MHYISLGYFCSVASELEKYGFDNTEVFLNEWNPSVKKRGTLEDSANVSEMMMRMHDTKIDMLMYYDGQVFGSYQGLFDSNTYQPFKTYYSFKAFNNLYKLGTRVEVTEIPEGVSAMAATNGEEYAVLVTNKGDEKTIEIEKDVTCKFRLYRINESSDLEEDLEYDGGIIKISKFETIVLLKCENDEK